MKPKNMFNAFYVVLLISKVSVLLTNSEDREDKLFNVTKTHPLYSEIDCYYPQISSFTKLLDNIYFLSTTDGHYWYQTGINNPKPEKALRVSTINSSWNQIDSAFYFSVNNECDFRFINCMFLLRYNENTGRNELLYRNLGSNYNFTELSWNRLTALNDAIKTRINWNKKIDAITANNDGVYIFQNNVNLRIDCIKKTRKYVIIENFALNISGPFDWAYFEDSSEDILPLYLVKHNYYYICHISKIRSNNITNCDQFELKHFPMIPKPFCWLKSYQNKDILISLLVFLIIILIFIIISCAFIYIYMGNQWKNSKIFQEKTKVKDNIAENKVNEQQIDDQKDFAKNKIE